MKYLFLWLLIINLCLFVTMGADKRRARLHKRRVPEARLFAMALIGGAMGGTLGMYTFRHKTRHWYFKFGFPLLASAQIFLLYILIK